MPRKPDKGLFSKLRERLDPAWVEEALEATGVATVRRRRLPAEQVLWLVLAMALFRQRSIDDVLRSLDLVLPGRDGKPISHSAIVQARERLGEEPVRWLFEKTARKWAVDSAAAHTWRGLSLWALDGTTVRVHDTDENREHFGKHASQHGESGYPIARVASVMAVRSHLMLAMRAEPHTTGEATLAADLWAQIPGNSLVIADRYFFSASVLIAVARDAENRHWLVRARKNLSMRTVKKLGRNDELVEFTVSHHAKDRDPTLPSTWVVRAIRYQRAGFPPSVLLTSMLDHDRFPAAEIAALYHERWEIELGYREVKRVMLEREETLRSKHPTTVYQEIWGLALAYNLIRLEMERAAAELKVPPRRISFKGALVLVQNEMLWLEHASPGAIPKHLRNLRAEFAHLILPERRNRPSYPRAVKLALSSYPRLKRKGSGTK